ncbi:hypothetical protein AYO47_03225 [Planctomyces sp. SCGC AG-212-M04]|nr:hypothetical protein AYO47_03225 [Planctomyces sp. SCGC AG-212-M04]
MNKALARRSPQNGVFAKSDNSPAQATDGRADQAAIPAATEQSTATAGTESGQQPADGSPLSAHPPRERAASGDSMSFAVELAILRRPEASTSLPPIVLPLAQLLPWQSIVDAFIAPTVPDFAAMVAAAAVSERSAASAARTFAESRYDFVVQSARTSHDATLARGNSALLNIAGGYQSTVDRLLADFAAADADIDSAFRASLDSLRWGAEAADLLILSRYGQARSLVSGAAASAKQAIKANADSSQSQINSILAGLGLSFITPLSLASTDCTAAAFGARQKLMDWKGGLAERYPGRGASPEPVEHEAMRILAPGMVDRAIQLLEKSLVGMCGEFTANIKLIQDDLRASVAPSLEQHAGQIREKGAASVDQAFRRTYASLKSQADRTRRANVQTLQQAMEQLRQLRESERQRIEQESALVLTAAHDEAAAASESLQVAISQSLPHYSNAVDQFRRSLTQAAARGNKTLRNVAEDGADGVAETVVQARDMQVAQIDATDRGVQQGLAMRVSGTLEQHAAALDSARRYLDESSNSASQSLLATSEASTEGFSAAAEGVTAAARGWMMPLAEAFSDFLKSMQKELARGQPAFDARLAKAKGDFTAAMQRQEDPEKFFDRDLSAARQAAIKRVFDAVSGLQKSLDAGIIDTIDEAGVSRALRGLTAIQGNDVRAKWGHAWQKPFTDPYLQNYYKNETGSDVYSLDGHLLVALDKGSDDYNAAINYLNGNTAAGALYELEASMHWYNDEESRIEEVMKSLTVDQLKEMHRLDKAEDSTASHVRDALGGTDLNVFNALDEGNHAAAEAYRFRDSLNEARERGNVDEANKVLAEYSGGTSYGGVELTGAQRREAVQRELARIQGVDLAAKAAEMQRKKDEDAAKAPPAAAAPGTTAPVSESATAAAVRLVTAATAPAAQTAAAPQTAKLKEEPTIADRWMSGMAPSPQPIQKPRVTEAEAASQSLFEYATRDITQVRSAGEGETYTVTLTVEGASRNLAHALIFHGEGSPEARAAQLGVEVERHGSPNIVNLDKALVDPRLSPNLEVANPAQREQIRAQALEERRQMLEIFARDYGSWKPGTGGATPAEILTTRLKSAFGSDTAGGELAALLVKEEHPSPETAARAMHYAVDGVGTNNELIDRTLGRMNRDEIREMRQKYAVITNGDDLYTDLGVFGHGTFGDLSGDDRLRAERMLLGQPRNDRERYEVSMFAVQQQRKETGTVGRWLASGSLQEWGLNAQEAELRSMGGADVTFGPDGEPQWSGTGQFTTTGNFAGNAELFRSSAESAEVAAQQYSSKIDQYADAAAMAVAIVGAIVATVVTGGMATAVLIAAATGLASMATQALIKGGRYGWEQALNDVGMTGVQMLTAGVGAKLAMAAQRAGAVAKVGQGAAAARQAVGTGVGRGAGQGLSKMLGGGMGRLTGSAFGDKVLIGMTTGGLGSLGQAAISKETWAKGAGHGIENLFTSTFRGILSGGVNAGVSNARGISRLGTAFSSGLGGFAGRGAELGFEASRGAYKGDADETLASMLTEGATSFAQGAAESRSAAIHHARTEAAATSPAGLHGDSDAGLHPRHDIDPQSAHQGGPSVGVHGHAGPEGPQIFRPSEHDDHGFISPSGDRVLPPNARPDPNVFGPAHPFAAGETTGPAFHPHLDDIHGQPSMPGFHPQGDHPLALPRAFGELDPFPATPRREPSEFDLGPTRRGSEPSAAGAEPTGSRTAPFREGTAAAIPGTEMQLRPDAEPRATPKALRAATTEAVNGVASLSGSEIHRHDDAGLGVTLQRADGKPARVRIEFGDTGGPEIANFRAARPGEGGDFVVTLSTRARAETHARAIAHELAEIRRHGLPEHGASEDLLTTRRPGARDARLSPHDVGRLAELELLSKQLDSARASASSRDAAGPAHAKVARLETEIDALAGHLGLLHTDPADPRMRAVQSALGDRSEAYAGLSGARRRAAAEGPADALRPGRAIDERSRLSARDRSELAKFDELASAADELRRAGKTKEARAARKEARDQLHKLGLLEADASFAGRLHLARAVFDPGSPATEFLWNQAKRTPLSGASQPRPTGQAGAPDQPVGRSGGEVRADLTDRRPALARMFAEDQRLAQRFDAAVDQLNRVPGGLTARDRAALAHLFRATMAEGGMGERRLRRNISTLERVVRRLAVRPDSLDPGAQLRMHRDLHAEGRRVLDAYEAGCTHESRGRSVRGSAELDGEMAQLRRALDRVRVTDDRIANALTLDGLQHRISRGSEVLRSHGDPLFATRATGDAMPNAVNAGHIRDRLRNTNPESLTNTELLRILNFSALDVRANGTTGQPLGRDLPGMGLERYLLTPEKIGQLRTTPPELAAQLQQLLTDYHRAHLVGPGFGDEHFTGMMLAPDVFNLGPQNNGIEAIIRLANEAGRNPAVNIQANGQRIAIPLANGEFEYVDILRRVTYVVNDPSHPPPRHVTFRLDPPPNAGWTMSDNNIPGLTANGIDPDLLPPGDDSN